MVTLKKYQNKKIAIYGMGLTGFSTAHSFKKSKAKVDQNFINKKIKDRNAARKKGDYKLADVIRKELVDNGVIIEDREDKTTWKYK